MSKLNLPDVMIYATPAVVELLAPHTPADLATRVLEDCARRTDENYRVSTFLLRMKEVSVIFAFYRGEIFMGLSSEASIQKLITGIDALEAEISVTLGQSTTCH